YSAFRRAMSTLLGHSLLHALQDRQRSSVSIVPGSFQISARLSPCSLFAVRCSLCPSCPVIASRSAFPLPRVLCRSSSVPMYDGHIVPPLFLRHTPAPFHTSTAPRSPCWSP